MKRFLAAALLAVSAQPALAQESCDLEATTRETGDGARFVQLLRCGDGDLVDVFTCTPGSGTVTVTIPGAPFDPQPGTTVTITFGIGDTRLQRDLAVTEPPPEAPDEWGASAVLKQDDPLWQALATPGRDVLIDNGDYTSNAGVVTQAAAKLAEFRRACGL